MALSSMLEALVTTLFGGGTGADNEADRKLIEASIEAIVETVEPRVRLRAGYQDKLAGGVRRTIAYLRSLAQQRFEPILLTRAAWSQDPRINAFFATADDVPACVGRSRELRAFFEDPQHSEVQEVYALLGMKKEERTVFAPRLEDGMLKQDVAQVAVSFSDHRLVAPSATLPELRLEVGRRIVARMAQMALERVVALDQKAADLQQRKAYLAARLRLLNLARDGMEGIVKDPATVGEQIKEIEGELKQTVDSYIEAKSSLATLDGYIAQIDAVLSHPEQHVTLTHTPLRINRMGIKVEQTSDEQASELMLAEFGIGDILRGAIAPVKVPRSELPPKEDLIAQAERYL
jgi:hypothetical protein